MTRALQRVVAFAVLGPATVAAFFACSSQATHPPRAAPGCPAAHCAPPVVGIGGDTGTADAATPADAAAEVGPVDLTGSVRLLDSFTRDPSLGLTPSGVVVRALRSDGTTASVTVGADGTFSLGSLAAAPLAWISVGELGAGSVFRTRSVVGVSLLSTPITGVVVPVYDPALPQVEASKLSGKATTGTATVVVQIVDAATGSPKSGLTATPRDTADGPYYDDGKDALSKSATATGGAGTLVFLGIAGGTVGFTVQLVSGGVSYTPIPMATTADAVTYLRVSI